MLLEAIEQEAESFAELLLGKRSDVQKNAPVSRWVVLAVGLLVWGGECWFIHEVFLFKRVRDELDPGKQMNLTCGRRHNSADSVYSAFRGIVVLGGG